MAIPHTPSLSLDFLRRAPSSMMKSDSICSACRQRSAKFVSCLWAFAIARKFVRVWRARDYKFVATGVRNLFGENRNPRLRDLSEGLPRHLPWFVP